MVILALFAPVSVFLVASSKVAGASIDSANGDASMMQLEYLKGYCVSKLRCLVILSPILTMRIPKNTKAAKPQL
jgi:hypothetical protein